MVFHDERFIYIIIIIIIILYDIKEGKLKIQKKIT